MPTKPDDKSSDKPLSHKEKLKRFRERKARREAYRKLKEVREKKAAAAASVSVATDSTPEPEGVVVTQLVNGRPIFPKTEKTVVAEKTAVPGAESVIVASPGSPDQVADLVAALGIGAPEDVIDQITGKQSGQLLSADRESVVVDPDPVAETVRTSPMEDFIHGVKSFFSKVALRLRNSNKNKMQVEPELVANPSAIRPPAKPLEPLHFKLGLLPKPRLQPKIVVGSESVAEDQTGEVTEGGVAVKKEPSSLRIARSELRKAYPDEKPIPLEKDKEERIVPQTPFRRAGSPTGMTKPKGRGESEDSGVGPLLDRSEYSDKVQLRLVNLIFDPLSNLSKEAAKAGLHPDDAHLLGLTRVSNSREALYWANQIAREAAFNKYVLKQECDWSIGRIHRLSFLIARRSIPGMCGAGFTTAINVAMEQSISRSEESSEESEL
jgi:hypothetical protein